MLQHLLGMEIRDQEWDIITLDILASSLQLHSLPTNLYRFPPQDKESFRSLRQEPRKLVYQNVLNLIRLLDLDTNAYTIYTRLDKDSFILVSGDNQGSKKNFRRCLSFYLWYVMSFRGLGCEVGEAEGGCQRGADALEVGSQWLGLYMN